MRHAPPPAPAGAPAAAGNDTLTSVAGVRVGHWTDPTGATGCTVVLLPAGGAVTSGLVLGPAPGSRETALLAPEKTVDLAHALVLSGGSAFGLAAAHGVMLWLEERDCGYATPCGPVPIVPAAVIYDLRPGRRTPRPDEAAGRAAADAATADPVAMGAVGVGAGATVGKLDPARPASRSGVGSASLRARGAIVAALAVSNAVGDLVDPDTGALVAGSGLFGDVEALMERYRPALGTTTTLVAVVTDAPLTKAQANALSLSAHVGIARVTRPSHTISDGDTAFVASTGNGPIVDVGVLSIAVQDVVARALLAGARAVQASGA